MTARRADRSALARYVATAALARTADGGAVVAVVLLVTMNGGSGRLAGMLAACITAPHLLGPFIARRIDLVDDGRRVLALGCTLYAASLAAAVASYGHVHTALTAALLITAGCCGPLLTGGISSRLPGIAREGQRRAQGWDVATYGIGGTVGPSMVAAVAASASPAMAGLGLALAAFCAGRLAMVLPYAPPAHGGDLKSVPGAWSIIALMARDGRLARTLCMTMLVAFSMAALPITAVRMAAALGLPAASAALLTAAYGIGNLSGSAGVMLRPLQGSPDRLMAQLGVLVLAGLFAVMMSPGFVLAAGAYWLAGVINAYFFAATLAARTEYAPAQGRGQVFLWVAALKITAGSAGTATAGALAAWGLRAPLLLAIGLVSAAVCLSALGQYRTARQCCHN